jgi:hypothetical protein
MRPTPFEKIAESNTFVFGPTLLRSGEKLEIAGTLSVDGEGGGVGGETGGEGSGGATVEEPGFEVIGLSTKFIISILEIRSRTVRSTRLMRFAGSYS